MSSRTRAPTTSSYLDPQAATYPGEGSSASSTYLSVSRAFDELQCLRQRPQPPRPSLDLTPPSQERLDSSLNDKPYETDNLTPQFSAETDEKRTTVLYLAYGSNLCDETFLGRRGIKPISQINVVVPELRLTFDLPGIPYSEPCFSNSGRRDPSHPTAKEAREAGAGTGDYHKDRWKKGLVGVVYEVSLKDYAHIIATEGGGAGYHDIVVTCYPLPTSDTVPESPSTPPFKTHTLFAPAPDPKEARDDGRFFRPDPSYAQPSARYLKLITDGAAERNLPTEYREYLADIRTFTITSRKQQMGQYVFLKIWLPIITFLMGLGPRFQDDKGRFPDWFVWLFAALFNGMWMSYDNFFKPLFGDGERTQESDGNDVNRHSWRPRRGEKQLNGCEQC